MTASARIRVAITDDHQIVIDGLSAALGNFRHIGIVATATSAARMLELLQEQRPDVLITDVMMPGMNGPELARRLLALRPEVPVVYASGYAHEAGLDPDAPFLAKPYSVAQLNSALREALDGRQPLAA